MTNQDGFDSKNAKPDFHPKKQQLPTVISRKS